jgi:hypothetical protein
MDEEKFKKLMDKWASHEMNAAPEIRPSSEVYQKLKDREKKPGFAAISWPVRWAAAGIAAAVIILFIILQPSQEIVPLVGLRKGFIGEKEEKDERVQALNELKVPREEKVPEVAKAPRAAAKALAKREKKAQIVSEQYVFQYQHPGTQAIEDLDIKSPQDKVITLSSEDNYRLVLELARERYVSIYQTGGSETLVRLFPNPEYQSAQNPLQPGKTYIFPSPPNWFYVQKHEGETTIYVVASNRPQPEWDDLYARYQDTEKKKEKKEILLRLTDAFTSIQEMSREDILIHRLKFYCP